MRKLFLTLALLVLPIYAYAQIWGDVGVSDDAYSSAWNGSVSAPTQNAVYDKIETINGSSGGGNYTSSNATSDTGMTGNGGYVYMSNQSNSMGLGNTSPNSKLLVQNSAGKAFALRIADSNAADKLVVTEAGNVGIGTTAPLTKLTIIPEDNGGIIIRETDNGQNAFRLQAGSTSGQFIAYMNGVATVKLDAYTGNPSYIMSGSVGIGTTAPSEKLDVQGNISVVSTSFYKGNASLLTGVGGDATGTVGNITIADTGVSGGTYGSATSVGQFAVGADGRITSASNVAINGTTSGWQDDGTIIRPIILSDSIGIGTSDPRGILHINNAGSAPQQALMVVMPSGNVGIGTSAPAAMLHIAGDVRVDGNWTQTGAGDAYINATGMVGLNNTLFVKNGNVGIGLTNPSASLHVTGNIKMDGGYLLYTDATDDYIWRGKTDYMMFATGAADKMAVGDNVGIGTTNPTAKLHVTGSTKFGDTIPLATLTILNPDAGSTIPWKKLSIVKTYKLTSLEGYGQGSGAAGTNCIYNLRLVNDTNVHQSNLLLGSTINNSPLAVTSFLGGGTIPADQRLAIDLVSEGSTLPGAHLQAWGVEQ